MEIVPLSIPAGARVLVTGAGGGFDFLCGLPIALELEGRGCEVHIGSYSFTDLHQVDRGSWHAPHLLEVTADSALRAGDYFPERLLCRWYRERRSTERSVWCFPRVGVVPLRAAYDALIERLGIDVVICVDGGIDGLFRGDEHDLGTPSMDSISIIATALCSARQRLYACTAFGVEGTEGNVSHAQALHRMADLVRQDALLGVGAILRHTEHGALFLGAVDTIFGWLDPLRQSVIVSALRAAMRGSFGPTDVHVKTADRRPWLSPLTLLVWYFSAEPVARMKLFYGSAAASASVAEVSDAIESLRTTTGVLPHETIPI